MFDRKRKKRSNSRFFNAGRSAFFTPHPDYSNEFSALPEEERSRRENEVKPD